VKLLLQDADDPTWQKAISVDNVLPDHLSCLAMQKQKGDQAMFKAVKGPLLEDKIEGFYKGPQLDCKVHGAE
jgi:hypothetical protein